MHSTSKSIRDIAAAIALIVSTSAVIAQPALPSPEATDPVKLELMQGFPPPPEKVVRLGSLLRFPNGRWGFHHLRELGPTAQVWRGDHGTTAARETPQEMGALVFDDDKGGRTTLADWQRTTYTDGLLVLHKGSVVYQRHYSGMAAHQPHALFSMSKSFTGLLATLLIKDGLIDPDVLVGKYLPELKDSAWASMACPCSMSRRRFSRASRCLLPAPKWSSCRRRDSATRGSLPTSGKSCPARGRPWPGVFPRLSRPL